MKLQNFSKKDAKSQNLSFFHKFLLALCGAFIGFVNGLFGGGGGMICVPLLKKVLSLDDKYAHATALVIIFPISFVSALIYCLSGSIKLLPFAFVGSGVLLGGIVGAFLLKFLPEKVIRLVFVAIMLAGGIRLIMG